MLQPRIGTESAAFKSFLFKGQFNIVVVFIAEFCINQKGIAGKLCNFV